MIQLDFQKKQSGNIQADQVSSFSIANFYNQTAGKAVDWFGRQISYLKPYLNSIPLVNTLVHLVSSQLASLYRTKFGKRNDLNAAKKNITIQKLSNVKNDVKEDDQQSPLKTLQNVAQDILKTKDVQPQSLDSDEVDLQEKENQKSLDDIFDEEKIEEGSIDDSKESEIDENEKIEEVESSDSFSPQSDNVHNQRDATVKILTTPGLHLIKNKANVFVKHIGGEKLETMTAIVTKHFPHAMGLPALKEFRDLNFEQYLAFKLKRFGHTFSLKGYVPLSSSAMFSFEAFLEVFVVPMQVACYELFAKKSKLFDDKENQWLGKKFNRIILSNYMTPREVKDLVTRVHAPDFVGPECLGTGFDAHSAGLVIFGYEGKLYLLFCDRSGISTGPGIYVFAVPDRHLITDDFINEISKRDEIDEAHYFIENKFMTDLGATVVHYEVLPAQDAGNCTHTSMQTTFYALKTAKYLLKMSQIDPILRHMDEKSLWKQAFSDVRPEHMEFIKFDEELVFNDFMDEVEEWIADPLSFGTETLRDTYQQTLETWLEKYQNHSNTDPAAIQRVENLSSILMTMYT